MGKIKDLVVKVGEYTNSNGETKNKYLTIGAIIEKTDGGNFMLLNRAFNPAGVPAQDGSDSIIVSMFDVKTDDANAPTRPAAAKPTAPAVPFDDEIPF